MTALLWLTAALLPVQVQAGSAGFHVRAKGAAVTVPVQAKPGSGVVGTFDASAVDQASIGIALPDGQTVVARQSHILRTRRQVTWEGGIPGSAGDTLSVTSWDGALSGVLHYRGETYELLPQADGLTLLYAVDTARLPDPGPVQPAVGPPTAGVQPDAIVGQVTAAAAPVVQDLLVVTTDAARAAYGAGLDTMIANAVAGANAAYRAGNLGITLNLVDIRPTVVTEGASMAAALDALKASTSVAADRNALAADVVILVSQNSDYCGQAYLMSAITTGFAPYAYGVVFSDCLSQATLPHEIGHIQGLVHDRETAGGNAGATPYGFGYRVCTTDGTGVRDIMSYPCTSGSAARINEFSNPLHTFNGHPFGIAYETDPANAADAVRALNDSAGTVAAFRIGSTVLPPAAPSALAATFREASTPVVDLAWHDGSGNEDGFAIERTTDGVNWAEIGRVASNTVAFTDNTVTHGQTYSYRVAAFNSAGDSAASNVATVATAAVDTTPDPFAFTSRSGVALSTSVTSAAVTIAGINELASVTVSGGEYSVGCGSTFTAAPGAIANGNMLCVRQTSAAAPLTSTTTTVTVGGVSASFESTTAAASSGGSAGGGGGGGGGGAFDWLLGMLLLGARTITGLRR